ncbi:MAG TPA: VOC family protein [Opitutales bacterium]|jgi:PhnB protein|nr:VOC family protein [Opitutales bacterium]
MQPPNIPNGYNQVMPHLIVENAAGFIQFMERVFNAKLRMKHMRSETIIMHAELQIGESVIMLADSTAQYPPRPAGMFIYVDDADARHAQALAAGATSVSPVATKGTAAAAGCKTPTEIPGG